ncbi:4-hydroxy-tetrahydrodipicolinate reductase [bacterium]|nr:4-hydroxy-tetrahydrodipicolinate reductase [bacterium]
MEKIKVAVIGAAGRMGRNILSRLTNDQRFRIVGAVERHQHPWIGVSLESCCGLEKEKILVTDSLDELTDKPGVLIDFSTIEVSMKALRWAHQNSVNLLTGTTGFNPDQLGEFKKASQNIAILQSYNMSIGVNLLFKLAGEIAEVIPDAEVEIIEKHHHNKVDAPSGTALKLSQIISSSLGLKGVEHIVHGRQGKVGKRKPNEIGIHSIRAGEIIGEHLVLFALPSENITIGHQAQSRDAFTDGVIRGILLLAGKDNGYYGGLDLLEEVNLH